MKNFIVLLFLVGCLPEQQASLIAGKISESTKQYCDSIKMNACVLKFIQKKQKQYKKVVIQSEDKAMAGDILCPVIAKAFSNWLVGSSISEKCGCRKGENVVLLSEKIEKSCISASPY